jgi:hypothetical protein
VTFFTRISRLGLCLVTLACRRGADRAPDASYRPLADYCRDIYHGPCPRYPQGLARLRQRLLPGAYCLLAEAGTCGAARYLTYSSGFEQYSEYYESQPEGRIIAAHVGNDTNPNGEDFGAVPPCDRKPSRDVTCP